ncbi:MAG: RND family transporter, partial [Halarsenatibacteraceae bacterium]
LGLSELTIIQEFGFYTAFGVFSALLLSTTFLPAVLIKLNNPVNYKATEDRPWLDKLFSQLYNLVINRSTIVFIIVIIIIALSIIGIPRIVSETNYITFFEEDSDIYQANQLTDQKMGGASTFEIIINSGQENGAEEVEFLRKVQELQTSLKEHELLNNPMSVVDLLTEANIAMNEGNQEFDRLPDGGIAQYYMLLSSGSSNILNEFIDFNHKEVRLRISAADIDDSQNLSEVIEYTQNQIFEIFPDYEFYSRDSISPANDADHPYVTLTGVPVLTDVISGLIITGQIWSLLGAVVLAFIVTSILLKSPLKGFACSIPVAFTVLFNFGIMGWTNVTLNVVTSMIASIAVGIGVDYGIHFYTRYLEELNNNANVETAIKKAMFTVGRANFFNAAAVIAGFLVLLLSSVPPLRQFGLLTSITMLVSFLGAMLILPALLMVKDKTFKALKKN